MMRRNFAKSVAGIAGIGVLGSVTVSADNSPTAKEIGIADEVSELLLLNRVEEAKNLMDEEGVVYQNEQTKIEPGTDFENDGDFSTDGHYDEGSSNFDLTILEYSGEDRWLVTGAGTLSNRNTSVRDASIIEDGMGVFFDTNEWTIDPSFDVVTIAATDSSWGADMTLDQTDVNEGVTALVDLPYSLGEDTQVSLQYLLEKTGTSTSAPVALDYEHTWAYANVSPQIDLSFGVPVPYANLEVNLTRASAVWSLPTIVTGPNL